MEKLNKAKRQNKNKKIPSMAKKAQGLNKHKDPIAEINSALFRKVVDSISDLLIVIDPRDYSIVTANKKYLDKEGISLKDIRGKKCYEITHKKNSPCLPPEDKCPMLETIKTRRTARAEHIHYGKNNEAYYSEVITYPILDDNGRMDKILHLSRDITEQRRREEENKRYVERLRELTLRDPHTWIYNYRYLMERLPSEIDLCKRHILPLSVLLIDIDYFKSINDVYGHQAGDMLLLDFVNFIKAFLRRSDVLTRYGGEEFIVVMPQTNKREALHVSERLIANVGANVFKVDSNSIKIKVSVGIAEFSLNSQDKLDTAKGLLDAADKAVQRAKDSGGNKAVVFSPLYKDAARKVARHDYKDEVEVLKRKLVKLSQRVDQAVLESMYAFSKSLEARDYYTAEHADKMIAIAFSIGKELGLDSKALDNLEKAAVLHDIGKIGISDAILRKKGKLTPEEYKIIQAHPQIGAEIIRAVHFLKDVVPIVLHHHERFDGTGYPSGLKNGEIPLNARIISIADAYQALTSDRPYRKAYTKDEALKILKDEAGTHFEKSIVNALIKIERGNK